MTPGEWFDAGVAHEKADRLTEAAAAYRKALAADPRFAEAWFNLGNLVRDAGLLDEAEKCFQAAVRHQPGLAEAWYNLGELRAELEQPERAVAAFLQAVDADPDYADAHYNLALCLERCGRVSDAHRHWREYLRLDRDSPDALAALRRLSAR